MVVSRGAFGLRIEAGPLLGRAGFDPREMLERSLPPGASVQYQAVTEIKTIDGWPVSIIQASVTDAGGALIEHCLAAVYTMMHWNGVAILRAQVSLDLESARPEVIDIFLSARPELWPKEPVCVAELWSLEQP